MSTGGGELTSFLALGRAVRLAAEATEPCARLREGSAALVAHTEAGLALCRVVAAGSDKAARAAQKVDSQLGVQRLWQGALLG